MPIPLHVAYTIEMGIIFKEGQTIERTYVKIVNPKVGINFVKFCDNGKSIVPATSKIIAKSITGNY